MVTHSFCPLEYAPVGGLTYPTLPQPADQNRTSILIPLPVWTSSLSIYLLKYIYIIRQTAKM